MLCELAIKNFAIIDDLRITFSGGLTILSGETGAGKSIIINAVNLLLGGRASADLIRTGYDAAELEVLFKVSPGSSAERILKSQGLDSEDGLLIRRVISSSNRHRIYINGRLATNQILDLITENLASISGQHAHQGILREETQLKILDQFGSITDLQEKVYKFYHQLVPLIQKKKECLKTKELQEQRTELLLFQKNEISSAEIKEGEDEVLNQEKIRLKNGELLHQTVFSCIESLYESEGSISERLTSVKKNLEKASRIDHNLLENVKAFDQTIYQLEDIAKELRSYLRKLHTDESRLNEIEERLDLLQKLKRKYGGSIDNVLSYLESVKKELLRIENISDEIIEVERKIKEIYDNLVYCAIMLSEKRKEAAKLFSKKVENELSDLKMPNTKFAVLVEPLLASNNLDPYLTYNGLEICDTGIDNVTLLISPNIGEELKPLANIASGGELSRVVLALKAILAKNESVETIIFDEVDAGIGGSVAEVVGKKLLSLSGFHQVICITHLPQIAKFGDHHYKITKHVLEGRTKTAIDLIGEEERVYEIARMLGGETITKATIVHAKEMLGKKT